MLGINTVYRPEPSRKRNPAMACRRLHLHGAGRQSGAETPISGQDAGATRL